MILNVARAVISCPALLAVNEFWSPARQFPAQNLKGKPLLISYPDILALRERFILITWSYDRNVTHNVTAHVQHFMRKINEAFSRYALILFVEIYNLLRKLVNICAFHLNSVYCITAFHSNQVASMPYMDWNWDIIINQSDWRPKWISPDVLCRTRDGKIRELWSRERMGLRERQWICIRGVKGYLLKLKPSPTLSHWV